MKDLYYMVELTNIDGRVDTVLIKEKDLVSFISNYDDVNYTLLNIHGIGPVNLDYKDFIKKEVTLEKGDVKNVK
jgi:hypothetical protein